MWLRFLRNLWLIGFLACCALACNLLDELEGPGETKIEQDKQQAENERAWRITQTYLHTTPEFIWSEKPQKTVDFENNLTQAALSKSCTWKRNDTATVEGEVYGLDKPKGAAAFRDGDTIQLIYPHSGAFGCVEQVLQTSHRWTSLPGQLKASEKVMFTVSADWSLKGSKECSNLMAGVSTEINASGTRITASRSGILMSKEPAGSIQYSAAWTVPAQSFSGDRLTISVRGTTGGVGYAISYEYQYVCN